jgi:replicative DNA helicase
MHGSTIVEAICFIADKYGVDISAYERAPTQEEVQRHRYQKICNAAADVCSKSLFAKRELLDWYKDDTGFDSEQIVDYDVGYSSDPATLASALFAIDNSITQAELDRLELTSRLTWTNALVYPIRDANGNVARFYNKPLTPPPDVGGKYIGTSNSHPLFTHQLLYGFHLIKKSLKENGHSIRVVEGQKTAIASRGVAIMGSSVHKAQLELLRAHGVKSITFGFDGDATGRSASLGIIDRLHELDGVTVQVAKMPDGMQADGVAKQMGRPVLDAIFKSAVSPIEYYTTERLLKYPSLTTTAKYEILNDLQGFIKNTTEFHLDISLSYLSKSLDIDKDVLKSHAVSLRVGGEDSIVNRNAEEALLRGLIDAPEHWPTVRQHVTDIKVFSLPMHQNIFMGIKYAHDRAFNIGLRATAVTSQAIRDELTNNLGHIAGIHDAFNALVAAPTKYSFEDALQRVVDLYKRRAGIDQSRLFASSLRDLNKPTVSIVSEYRKQLVSTIEARSAGIGTPNRLVEEIESELHDRSLHTGAVIGFDFSNLVDVNGEVITCLPGLTLGLSGLQRAHQIILSAHSGVGKSLLALQMAVSLSICPPSPEDRIPVLWIPLEMNRKEIMMRIISLLTGIDNNRVQTANFSPAEQSMVKKALEMIAQGKLFIQKPRTGSIGEIYSLIDEFKFKHGIEGVALDYIQMVLAGKDERGMKREEVIGNASKVMKDKVAEELNIFSLCVAQQNRSNYEAGDTGSIENIGGSYQISQDADDAILLATKTPEQIAKNPDRGNRKAFIDKRRGGVSDVIIDYYLDDATTRCLRMKEATNPAELMGMVQSMGGKI